MSVRARRVFRFWEYPIFTVLTALNFAAVASFVHYWFNQAPTTDQPLAYALLSIPLVVGLAMFGSRWRALPLMRRPCPMAPAEGLEVGVATTFVPASEPIEMLEMTVRDLVAMDYRHDTWVLAEGDEPRGKALCERLGARHFSRKGRRGRATRSATRS